MTKDLDNLKKYDASLLWALSERCNLDCEYCFNNKRTDGIISKIKIDKVLKTLDNTKKTYLIILSGGGEPFLVDNFIELCESLTKKHYISIISNLTSYKVEEFIKKIEPNKVNLFIASMHLKELMNKNLLKIFMRNLSLLKKRGYNLVVTEVAYPGLIKEFNKYNKFIKKMNCKLEFFPYCGHYNNKSYPESYTKKELEFFSLKDRFKIKRNFQYKRVCNAGYNIAYVREDGKVELCTQIPLRLGNINEKIMFRKKIIKCSKQLCTCPLNDYCNIYLYNRAIEETRHLKPLLIRYPNFLESIFLIIDRVIGLYGILIKRLSPSIYYTLNDLKNKTISRIK